MPVSSSCSALTSIECTRDGEKLRDVARGRRCTCKDAIPPAGRGARRSVPLEDYRSPLPFVITDKIANERIKKPVPSGLNVRMAHFCTSVVNPAQAIFTTLSLRWTTRTRERLSIDTLRARPD